MDIIDTLASAPLGSIDVLIGLLFQECLDLRSRLANTLAPEHIAEACRVIDLALYGQMPEQWQAAKTGLTEVQMLSAPEPMGTQQRILAYAMNLLMLVIEARIDPATDLGGLHIMISSVAQTLQRLRGMLANRGTTRIDRRTEPGQPSAAARAARLPFLPEDLVDARHESIHTDAGRGRAARTARTKRRGRNDQ